MFLLLIEGYNYLYGLSPIVQLKLILLSLGSWSQYYLNGNKKIPLTSQTRCSWLNCFFLLIFFLYFLIILTLIFFFLIFFFLPYFIYTLYIYILFFFISPKNFINNKSSSNFFDHYITTSMLNTGIKTFNRGCNIIRRDLKYF